MALIDGIALINMSDEEFDNKYNNPENPNNSSGTFQRLNKFDELKKLGDLKVQGILSDEEFEIEKNKILGNKLVK
jgi:Short C-terminal domain